jgi:hypothetical protein
MASKNNSPSESLINAVVASLVGGVPAIRGPDVFQTATTFIGGLFRSEPSSINVVKLYHSSLVPSVLANGQNVQIQLHTGPVRIDEKCLAPEFDYDFTNKRDDGKKYVRGNEPYERPYGSYRMALKVKDQFGNDNIWLGDTGTERGEWPVSYHGTALHNAKSIAEDGYDLTKGKRFLHGKGIYSTPEIWVAKLYAVKFEYDGDSYSCILQNRVNPKYLKVFSKKETEVGIYWLSNDDKNEVDETELIRPYGICIFKEN